MQLPEDINANPILPVGMCMSNVAVQLYGLTSRQALRVLLLRPRKIGSHQESADTGAVHGIEYQHGQEPRKSTADGIKELWQDIEVQIKIQEITNEKPTRARLSYLKQARVVRTVSLFHILTPKYIVKTDGPSIITNIRRFAVLP